MAERKDDSNSMIVTATITEYMSVSSVDATPEMQREFYDFLLDGSNCRSKDEVFRTLFYDALGYGITDKR